MATPTARRKPGEGMTATLALLAVPLLSLSFSASVLLQLRIKPRGKRRRGLKRTMLEFGRDGAKGRRA